MGCMSRTPPLHHIRTIGLPLMDKRVSSHFCKICGHLAFSCLDLDRSLSNIQRPRVGRQRPREGETGMGRRTKTQRMGERERERGSRGEAEKNAFQAWRDSLSTETLGQTSEGPLWGSGMLSLQGTETQAVNIPEMVIVPDIRVCFSVAGGSSRGSGDLLGLLSPQLALPHLRKSQGNIINISSLVGAIGQVQAVPYVATKVPCPFLHSPPGPPRTSALRHDNLQPVPPKKQSLGHPIEALREGMTTPF